MAAPAIAQNSQATKVCSVASCVRRLDDGGAPSDADLAKLSIRNAASFGTAAVEVHDYSWAQPYLDVWTSDAHLLHFALSGRLGPGWAVYVDGRRRTKETTGRMTFVPAGRAIQSCGPSGRPQRSLICLLSSERVESVLPGGVDWDEASLGEGLRLKSPEIERLLLQIYGELKDPTLGMEAVIESLLNAIIVMLARRLGVDAAEAALRSGGLAPWRLNRVRERIHAELPAPSIVELAELSSLSVRHLSRAFKAETGQTIASYIQQAIIQRACALLSDSDVPIGEVGRRLGYATPASFSSAFRRATGQAPSEVRDRRINTLAGSC